MVRMPLSHFAKDSDFPFFIQYGFHDAGCYMHGHADFSELVVVTDGSAEHLVGEERYPIAKGDVFVINQYTEHGYSSTTNFKICNIMFQPETMFAGIGNLREAAGFQALFVLEPHYLQTNRFCSRLCLNAREFDDIMQLIEQLMYEYTKRYEGWQTMIHALFLRLCVRLSRDWQESDREIHKDIGKLAAATAYMEKHFSEDLRMEKLAEIAGYSVRQFTRLFRAAYAVTPMNYLVNLRMQKAMQLLKNTALSVGEAAWRCGYEDQNYFSRIFRQYAGMTPSEYRSQNPAMPYST